MVSRSATERELGRCIDAIVDEMNGIYCADLTDEAKVESMIGDIGFRDELVGQVEEIIRCRKLSERIMAEQSKEVTYEIRVAVSSKSVACAITRNDARSRMPSE